MLSASHAFAIDDSCQRCAALRFYLRFCRSLLRQHYCQINNTLPLLLLMPPADCRRLRRCCQRHAATRCRCFHFASAPITPDIDAITLKYY